MNRLLLDGMLPLYGGIVRTVTDANALYWPIIMAFILLASVTVMNMLIGVLVEVVRTVAATEKEGMIVAHVSHRLREIMDAFNNGEPVAPPRRLSMTGRIMSIQPNQSTDTKEPKELKLSGSRDD